MDELKTLNEELKEHVQELKQELEQEKIKVKHVKDEKVSLSFFFFQNFYKSCSAG